MEKPEKVHKAFAEYRAILSRELDREGLTSEDRFKILEKLGNAIDKESAKDSEHKAFAYKMFTTVASVVVLGVGAGAAILGGKAKIGGGV